MNNHECDDMLAAYEDLARLAAEARATAHARDWETFALQQEHEAAAFAALKLHEKLQPYAPDVLARQEALIRRILADHQATQALILPWRDEIAAQLQSTSSSRMLARTYGS